MVEQENFEERRQNFNTELQKGVKQNGLPRVRLNYMDVGPRAEAVQIKAPPGHVEALHAEMAKKIERNDYENSRGEREMLDIVVR